ncbi:MAG: hypothetical protein COW85_07345, partial [Ignavibacteria bacterium CG22_combo_CG10-13_8_21_14_all_37_15]
MPFLFLKLKNHALFCLYKQNLIKFLLMKGKSLDIQQNQLEKLKQLFPEAITEGKVDWEKLQA